MLKTAGPGQPVEILGLMARRWLGTAVLLWKVKQERVKLLNIGRGETVIMRRRRGARGSVEQMLSAIAAGEAEELPVVIKTDVHGSLEAIRVALKSWALNRSRYGFYPLVLEH